MSTTLDAPGIHSDASSSSSDSTCAGAGSSFPGHGEDAPLDLSGLTDAGLQAVTARLTDGSFDAFAETATAVKNCAHPVRLTGRSHTFELGTRRGHLAAVGDHLSSFHAEHAPMGVLYRACGNRRADVCPACSRTYARDTFAMIRAGLLGGKTISTAVANNPLLFITLTAPSFETHHHRHDKTGGRCRPRARDKGTRCPHGRPVSCMARHEETDAIVGAPMCPKCLDIDTAVIWQWWAPELWRRTTIALRRALATHLHVAETALKKTASLQFAKVAEYQARGMVHFHALIRLDGNDGPGSPAPLAGHTLSALAAEAIADVEITVPPVDRDDVERDLSWGQQLDIRVVREGDRTDDPTEALAPEQVAGYLAKYATKDAHSVKADAPRQHLRDLENACRRMATRAKTAHDAAMRTYYYDHQVDVSVLPPLEPYKLLGKWAHMLGFRGHFSTKSRNYSLTLGKLRRARLRYQQLTADARRNGGSLDRLSTAELEAQLLSDDADTTLVIGQWAYQGTGWDNPGDQALALAAAARAREYDQWKAQTKNTNR